jgi:hypothetical protein
METLYAYLPPASRAPAKSLARCCGGGFGWPWRQAGFRSRTFPSVSAIRRLCPCRSIPDRIGLLGARPSAEGPGCRTPSRGGPHGGSASRPFELLSLARDQGVAGATRHRLSGGYEGSALAPPAQTPRVHHSGRRCGGVAVHGTRAATDDAGDWVSSRRVAKFT